MSTATVSTTTHADGTITVEGWTWQVIYQVGEFWRIAGAIEPSLYFDEVDSLGEAIEFVLGGASDADLESMD